MVHRRCAVGVLYRPTLQWQGEQDKEDPDPYGWKGCGPHSVAMGVDAVSGGAVVPSGFEVRNLTNEAVPDTGDPGLVLPQLIAACERFGMHFIDRTGKAWNVCVNDLKAKRWVVLNVWYASLPARYRSQTSAAFGHSMGVMAVSGDGLNALLFDPLAHAERWVPLEALRAAAEEWGSRCNRTGKVIYMASIATIPVVAANEA